MSTFLNIRIVILLLLLSVLAHAEAPQFSQEEKAQHRAGLAAISQAMTDCLESTLQYHDQFFRANGFSPFYGDAQKTFDKMNSSQRIEFIAEQTGRDPNQIARAIRSIKGNLTGGDDGEFKNMSCVGIVMRCMGNGFRAAGQKDIWKKIRDYVVNEKDSDGTFLQLALRNLGWTVSYWNPDVTKNALWDQQEKDAGFSNVLRGYHAELYRQVLNKHSYYYTPVDDATSMINFGVNTPAALKAAPIFVATAHQGYHVFAGAKGRVVEGHAGRGTLSFDIVEGGKFSPLLKDGKPSGQQYKSGMIAVPPAF